MPGCCRTLAHRSQVMVMPRFSAQRSSGPGSLLEVLHVMRFLGVPLTSPFCLQMLEHPWVSGSQVGDGPVVWPPREDRPAAPTAQPRVAAALVLPRLPVPRSRPAPRSPPTAQPPWLCAYVQRRTCPGCSVSQELADN